VLTLDYWKLADSITAGDYVFDRLGNPVKVTLVQKYRATTCYEVTFNDHLTVAGDNHLRLPIEDKDRRNKIYRYKGKLKFRSALKPFTVEQLIDMPLKNNRNRSKYAVPTAEPLNLPHQILPVPPFLFGCWIFNRPTDGSMNTPPEYEEFVHQQFNDHGYKVKVRGIKKRRFTTNPTIVSHLLPHIPSKIPNNYLLASAEQRLELLKGIIHSKSRQYNKKRDEFRFSSYNPAFTSQVQYLAESLGCKTIPMYDPYYKMHTVFIKTRLRLVSDQVSPPVRIHQARRYISKISEIQEQMCVHIETDGPDNTILVGEGFISVC
jgi:hypothetical protein